MAPRFAETQLHVALGKTFVIEARNLAPKNIYVVAATLNDEPMRCAWLRHIEIVNGGRLVLTLGYKPGTWGRTSLPPDTAH